MTKYLPFIYDKSGIYINPKCYFMTGNNIKYIVSILNSKPLYFLIKQMFPELLGGTRELQKRVMINVPIPKLNKAEQKPFIELVDKILEKKEKNLDTTTEEREIDMMVYKLYGLTYEEVKVIEPDFAMSREEYEKFEEEV
jgi:adenine-specific DNA-methyltransferase